MRSSHENKVWTSSWIDEFQRRLFFRTDSTEIQHVTKFGMIWPHFDQLWRFQFFLHVTISKSDFDKGIALCENYLRWSRVFHFLIQNRFIHIYVIFEWNLRNLEWIQSLISSSFFVAHIDNTFSDYRVDDRNNLECLHVERVHGHQILLCKPESQILK